MSEENKCTCVRRGEREWSHDDNQTVPNVQESMKSVVRDNDHNFEQESTKNSTLTKENIIITLMKGLYSITNIVIENGIKYTLYHLYFYLFDAICWIFFGFKKTCCKNHKRKKGRKQIHQNYRNQKMGNNNSNGKPFIEPQNAEKDSISFRDQSSNGSNKTIINMPMNCRNIDSCISHTALKKPMYISTEEHSFDKRQFPINVSQDTEPFANKRSNAIRNKFPKSYTQKQRSNSFVNKGNARIFNQKFTSSDNMHSSFPRSFSSYRYRQSKQTNSFYNGEDSKFSSNSRIKFTPTNEKENFIFDEERNGKHAEKEIQEKRNFRRDGPTKYKSYYSRIHVGNQNQIKNQNKLKYKEMGTQTDSAFSTGNAVKMVSVGTMCPEEEIYENATHKYQDTDTNQQVNYIPPNEPMDERLLSIAYQLFLCNNTSSLVTNLSSDEHTCAAPDINNIAEDGRSAKFVNSINTSEPTRTPPGFPEVLQQPPLAPSTYDPEHFILPSIKDEYVPKFPTKPVTVTSIAPSPMRYLYYD